MGHKIPFLSGKNVYFVIEFVVKKTVSTYLILEIRVEGFAFKYIFFWAFRNKSDDYPY